MNPDDPNKNKILDQALKAILSTPKLSLEERLQQRINAAYNRSLRPLDYQSVGRRTFLVGTISTCGKCYVPSEKDHEDETECIAAKIHES